MGMNTTEAAETGRRNSNAFEVGKFDASVIADHYVFNMAAAIDKRPDLSTGFVGQFGELARELRRHDLVRGNPPGVELFYSAKLIRLEARGVSDNVPNSNLPPFTLGPEARMEVETSPGRP
jgi:hypothetical protein